MCKKGDIILVHRYKCGDVTLTAHPFVVLKDDGGEVCGFNFDFITLVMSSFKNEAQKEAKLKYPGNFPISSELKTVTGMENKDAYIKAEQFYFFTKANLDYVKIGRLDEIAWEQLKKFIAELPQKGVTITRILDNL